MYLRSPKSLCAIIAITLACCSTPEQTSRAVKGGAVGAGIGGLMGGWSGAATGAAVTGLLGAATATGDSRYGQYPRSATPARASSGNTGSRSSGSMSYGY